nr:MAG TPA: hypothetical protein [Caudoviricetes sp.]
MTNVGRYFYTQITELSTLTGAFLHHFVLDMTLNCQTFTPQTERYISYVERTNI